MNEWIDPDTGTVWQMYYDVPQGGSDERERVMYRVKGFSTWQELPPFAHAPKEIEAEWFGEVKSNVRSIETEPTPNDLWNMWGLICQEFRGNDRAWMFVERVLAGINLDVERPEGFDGIDGLTNDDLNDLFGAVYRLTKDLKRLKIIPEDLKANLD